MSQLSRLKEAEIANGNLINADDLSAELDQLVAESNSQDSRLTGIESGALTLNGVKTFATAPKLDQLDERSTNAGILVDGVRLKDSLIRVSGAPTEAGEVGYVNGALAYHNGSSVIHTGSPKGYIGGSAPVYTNASTVTFPAGLRARDTSNTVDMELTGDVAVSLASSGAGGLDAGTEASNTWYYFYLIRKSSDGTTSVVASTVNESATGSITYPSGYDQKRQLPIAVRNNASGNIIPFYVFDWGMKPGFLYEVTNNPSFTCETAVVTAGSLGTWTSASTASFIPPTSALGYFHLAFVVGNSSQYGAIRPGSTSGNGYIRVGNMAQVGDYDHATGWMAVDSSQIMNWIVAGSNGDLWVSVMGWKWTAEV